MSARGLLCAAALAVLPVSPAWAKPDARPPAPSTQRAVMKKPPPPKVASKPTPPRRRLDPRDEEVVRNLKLLKNLELLEVLDLLIKVRK